MGNLKRKFKIMVENKVPKIRSKAPEWEGQVWMPDGQFKKIDNKQYEGKYLVIFFWPLDFTFVCPTEIANFSDAFPEFAKINANIVGCSIDSHFVHAEWTKKPRSEGGLGPMKIPMLADTSKSISSSFGCLIDEGDDAGIALRATYIIDPTGTLRHASLSDLPVGRNVDEVLRLVQAFQYSDEHGEVCPSGWKPGKATMVPDHKSAKLAAFWAEEHDKK